MRRSGLSGQYQSPADDPGYGGDYPLGEKLGGSRQTFGGLAGMGDLIVTCTSMHSRNRRAGILIGQGKTPREAMEEVGAVEMCIRDRPLSAGRDEPALPATAGRD